jgi:ectoine hydroxylase-related dioxygenase (phytanoyl-CoA dioxygenase family)
VAEEDAIELSNFESEGYAFHAGAFIGQAECVALGREFEDVDGAGARHLLDCASVRSLLREPALRAAVHAILGTGAFAYKATLFDKHEDANWLVAWHQDISIPVAGRLDIEGWRGWSMKDGVQYVQPPDNILASLVALRLHLDPCESDNGPLRVLPKSHAFGRLDQAEIAAMAQKFSRHVVTGEAGSALLMRPLLIHASSKATLPGRRRVLHLEFAGIDLVGGLEWHRRVYV